MALIMKKFIDVLQMSVRECPYFIVDTSVDYVPVTSSARATFQIWTVSGSPSGNYRQAKFQNRDNIQILSVGMYLPENFTFTSIDAPVFDNTLALPVLPAVGDAYTALADANTWAAGYIYRWNGVEWLNQSNIYPGPYINLEVTNVEGVPGPALPGFGCSNTSSFALPFPNYELVLDSLYCDICNIDAGKVVPELPLDDFYLQGSVLTPNVSMIGVPAALDGRVMHIIPFIKIAHTCNIDNDPLP